MKNVTGSPISTLIGLAGAGIVGLQQYIAAGNKLTWQTGLLMFFIAVIGAAKNDNSFNMGVIDKMVLGHVQAQLEQKEKQLSQTAGK